MADTKTSNEETDLTTLFDKVVNKKKTVKENCNQWIFSSEECKKAKGELKDAEQELKKAKENHFNKKQKEEKVPEGKLKRQRHGAGALQNIILSRKGKLKF